MDKKKVKESYLGVALGMAVVFVIAVLLSGCAIGKHARAINVETTNIASGASTITNTTAVSVPIQPYSDLGSSLIPLR